MNGGSGGGYRQCPHCGQPSGVHASFRANCGYSFYLQPPPPAAMPPDSTKLIVALLLSFFLGTLGAHRFYLGHTSSGIAMLLLSLLGYATLCILVGVIPLLAVGIWWLVAVFLLITGTWLLRMEPVSYSFPTLKLFVTLHRFTF